MSFGCDSQWVWVFILCVAWFWLSKNVIATGVHVIRDLLAVPAFIRRILIEPNEGRAVGCASGISPNVDRISRISGPIVRSAGVRVSPFTDPGLPDLPRRRIVCLARNRIREPVDRIDVHLNGHILRRNIWENIIRDNSGPASNRKPTLEI